MIIDYCCRDLKDEMEETGELYQFPRIVLNHKNQFYVVEDGNDILHLICCPFCGKELSKTIKDT